MRKKPRILPCASSSTAACNAIAHTYTDSTRAIGVSVIGISVIGVSVIGISAIGIAATREASNSLR